MPTLPPELILHILTYAADSPLLQDPYQRFKTPWFEALRTRALLLRDAALVARDWTRPAQSLLFEVLYLNPSRARDMLDRGAPFEAFNAAEVCFELALLQAFQIDSVKEVLGRLHGVQTLCVSYRQGETVPLLDYLALPNLKDVTTLDLRHGNAGDTDPHLGDLPFRLTHLALRTPTSPAIVDTLLPTVLDTLTNLHINLLRAPAIESSAFTSKALLEAVAPQLLSLDISHYTNRVGQGIDLPLILSRGVRLTSLHLPFDRHLDPDSRQHLDPLRAIPPTVRFLHLQDYFPLWAVTEWLGERKYVQLVHVEIAPRRIGVPAALWHLREEEEGLQSKCEELGIRFSVAEKGQQPISSSV